MTQRVGAQVEVYIKTYDENKEIVEEALIYDLNFKTKKEGYEVSSEPIIQEVIYYKIIRDGEDLDWIPTKYREDADLVSLYATAEAIKKEAK